MAANGTKVIFQGGEPDADRGNGRQWYGIAPNGTTVGSIESIMAEKKYTRRPEYRTKAYAVSDYVDMTRATVFIEVGDRSPLTALAEARELVRTWAAAGRYDGWNAS